MRSYHQVIKDSRYILSDRRYIGDMDEPGIVAYHLANGLMLDTIGKNLTVN